MSSPSRDMSIMQLIKDDDCLGSKIQTEHRGSVFPPFGVMKKVALEDSSEFLGTVFAKQEEVVGLSPALPEPRTVPQHHTHSVSLVK